jgi:hypothetical protein
VFADLVALERKCFSQSIQGFEILDFRFGILVKTIKNRASGLISGTIQNLKSQVTNRYGRSGFAIASLFTSNPLTREFSRANLKYE